MVLSRCWVRLFTRRGCTVIGFERIDSIFRHNVTGSDIFDDDVFSSDTFDNHIDN